MICGTGIASADKRDYRAGKRSAAASGTIQKQPEIVNVQRMNWTKSDALSGDLPDVNRMKSKLKGIENYLIVSSDTLL